MGIDKVSSFLFARSLQGQAYVSGDGGAASEQSRSLGSSNKVHEVAIVSKRSSLLDDIEERRNRVAELRNKITSGSYRQPDGVQLAKSVLLEVGA